MSPLWVILFVVLALALAGLLVLAVVTLVSMRRDRAWLDEWEQRWEHDHHWN